MQTNQPTDSSAKLGLFKNSTNPKPNKNRKKHTKLGLKNQGFYNSVAERMWADKWAVN